MELRELLSHLGRRLWLLVIIPLAAVLLVLGLNAPSGTRFSSSVDLRATNPTGDQTVAAVNLVAGSLANAVHSDAVAERVGQEAGTKPGRVAEGLTARRISDTELVHVTFADTDKALVVKVMQALPAAVQEATFAPAIRQAELAQGEAQKSLDAALAELEQVRAETGLFLPDRQYQEAANLVTSLKVALASAQGRSDGGATAPIQDALSEAEARVAEVLKGQEAFVAPQYAVDNARSELAARKSAVGDVKARQASSVAESIQTEPQPLSWITEVLRRGISAALVGLALAVLLLAIPAVLRRSRNVREDEYIANDPQLWGPSARAGSHGLGEHGA